MPVGGDFWPEESWGEESLPGEAAKKSPSVTAPTVKSVPAMRLDFGILSDPVSSPTGDAMWETIFEPLPARVALVPILPGLRPRAKWRILCHNRRFVLRTERVESRACARKQAELGGGVAELKSSTNSVQVTPQMCVNPSANPRMDR